MSNIKLTLGDLQEALSNSSNIQEENEIIRGFLCEAPDFEDACGEVFLILKDKESGKLYWAHFYMICHYLYLKRKAEVSDPKELDNKCFDIQLSDRINLPDEDLG